jgi:N6-adenosine-specific RNA methylase IME4
MTVTPIIDPEFSNWIFPLASDELAVLEGNILRDGCRDPLLVWAGQNILVDGHNRFNICQKHGLPYKTKALEFASREAVVEWMDTNQLGRRNLTNDQRSLLRGRLYNRTKMTMAEAGARSLSQSATSLDTAAVLAEKHGVHRATIIRDGKRAEFFEELQRIAPDEARAVWRGEKRLNEVRRTVARAKVQITASLPDAKYRVIYADPPWNYGNQITEDYGAARFHYPTMTIRELCEMEVPVGKDRRLVRVTEISEPDAVLFLWVTSPLLRECWPVIHAWGFTYKASFIWDKVLHNMGHYNSVRHEFLLIATRGSCTPDVPELIDSVQTIERTKHSEKPEEFRTIIETLYPHGRRVELFARKEAAGWDRWGNQA